MAEWVAAPPVDADGKERKGVVGSNFTNEMRTSGALGIIMKDERGKAVLGQACNRIFFHPTPFDKESFDTVAVQQRLEGDVASKVFGGGLQQTLPGGASSDASFYVSGAVFVQATVKSFCEDKYEKFTNEQAVGGRNKVTRDSFDEVQAELNAQIKKMGDREPKWGLYCGGARCKVVHLLRRNRYDLVAHNFECVGGTGG